MSAQNKNDTHEMVNAKIHVMQHDLDEIAKNGHVEIEPSQKKTPEQQKPAIKIPSENVPVPSDSPFSQSEYAVETNKTEQARPAEEAAPQTSKTSFSEKSLPEESKNTAIPSYQSSTPLNLPTFHATPATTPRGPMHLNIGRQTPSDFLPESPPQTEPQSAGTSQASAVPQESIRTGTWPVDSPEKPTSHKKLSSKKTAKKVALRKTPTDKKTMSDNIILKEQWGWKQYLALLAVIGSIGGGAFYFWKTRLSGEEFNLPAINLPNIPDISSNKSADDLRDQPEKSLPFSTTNANPFIVDVETETVSTLREKLMQNANTMRQANMTGPVPFSIADKTNTPIAFFIFASIFNLGLSGDLLNSLDNDFTLSLFLDNGEPRIILSIKTKDIANTTRYLTTSERTLPLSLKNILLVDTPPSVPTATFSSATYRDIAIRYFNLSTEAPLSFDYAFVDNTLVLSTSKNAERAAIDTFVNPQQ